MRSLFLWKLCDFFVGKYLSSSTTLSNLEFSHHKPSGEVPTPLDVTVIQQCLKKHNHGARVSEIFMKIKKGKTESNAVYKMQNGCYLKKVGNSIIILELEDHTDEVCYVDEHVLISRFLRHWPGELSLRK